MQATYPRSWLWFLVAIVMVPLAYWSDETILGRLLYERQHRRADHEI